jgi:hypothetical protein
MFEDPRFEIIKERTTEMHREDELTRQEREDLVKIGIEIENMTQTAGWKILKVFLEKNSEISNFLTCDESKLVYLRERVRAYLSVLYQVERWITVKNKLLEEKEESHAE